MRMLDMRDPRRGLIRLQNISFSVRKSSTVAQLTSGLHVKAWSITLHVQREFVGASRLAEQTFVYLQKINFHSRHLTPLYNCSILYLVLGIGRYIIKYLLWRLCRLIKINFQIVGFINFHCFVPACHIIISRLCRQLWSRSHLIITKVTNIDFYLMFILFTIFMYKL